MAAAEDRLRLSAAPHIGTATIRSAKAASTAGSPQASLPINQADGFAKPPEAASRSSGSPSPSAASTCMPRERTRETASARSIPVRIGRWNSDPTDERTVLGFHTSTDPEVRMTPSAPKASAQRITVPAFPGSRTWAQITSRRASSTSSQPNRGCRHTATTPCGVTVSDNCRTTASEPHHTGISRSSTRSAWRSGSATITPVTRPSVASASRTAWRPSARNSPASSRPRRFLSRRTERSTEPGSSRAAFELCSGATLRRQPGSGSRGRLRPGR